MQLLLDGWMEVFTAHTHKHADACLPADRVFPVEPVSKQQPLLVRVYEILADAVAFNELAFPSCLKTRLDFSHYIDESTFVQLNIKFRRELKHQRDKNLYSFAHHHFEF